MSEINRRRFLKQASATSAVAFPAVLTQKGLAAKAPASERVRVGMVGAAGPSRMVSAMARAVASRLSPGVCLFRSTNPAMPHMA